MVLLTPTEVGDMLILSKVGSLGVTWSEPSPASHPAVLSAVWRGI